MPSLPSKTARRKHVTPIANLHENDVWQRTFKLLGLQPLTPFPDVAPDQDNSRRSLEMASALAIEAPGVESSVPEKPKITILRLPAETQKEIFRHASSTDLIALSLVSKHFRDLAAAQLYRNFHIVFPDEDDPSYESPIDGLAGGLDTMVTSEYNYASYLKEIVLDTLSGGNKGERAYRHYTYDLSCGKFMNTLFLLAIRKAHALEKFEWNLRVEISRPVFKALHQKRALQHLHIRMQAGPSLYETPPPLPSLAESDSAPSTMNLPSSSAGPPTPLLPGLNSYPFAKNALRSKVKAKDNGPPNKVPPTLSGFKNLKSLAVLDMDTLNYVAEIKACLRASSSTIKKLKLSFSEGLARQARKPPPAEDPGDESDQEIDEFGNVMPAPPPPVPSATEDVAGPAKAFRAQEEKKTQEAVLGRLFGVETSILKKGDGCLENTSDSEDKVEEEKDDAGKAFIKDLTSLSKKLISSINGQGSRTQQQKDALEIIEKAAKTYVEAQEKAKLLEKKASDEATSEASTTAKPTPESSAASVAGKAEDENHSESRTKEVEVAGEVGEKSAGLFDGEDKTDRKATQAVTDGVNPDDINVDAPEVEADLKDFEDVPVSEAQSEEKVPQPAESNPSDDTAGASDLTAQGTPADQNKENLSTTRQAEVITQIENFHVLKGKLLRHQTETEALQRRITDIAAAGEVDQEALNEAQRQQSRLQAEVASATALMRAMSSEVVELRQRSGGEAEAAAEALTLEEKQQAKVNDYIRDTRGLALRGLAIYLIPIKASVLSKAIDVTVLKHLTLLNVGPQAPFWIHLTKENKMSPLPLQKIHTDNVTPHFLTLASQLDTLRELFLLERNSKVPEYSFAPKTIVTIDQIRKMVLKKHVGTLEKLMIKNENDYSWDANEQTIKLLCKRGKQLEELAVSFGVRAVHTFNQYLPGLVNLRAMHMINFRNDDTCHWVIREIRKFAVDSVSHNPEMKLEFIALENTVERLVRRMKKPKSKGKGKATDKGKGKETTTAASSGSTSGAFPTMESILAPPAVSDSSEDESVNSEDEVGPGLKLETLEGVRFYDIYGVRIFRKDVMMGRL